MGDPLSDDPERMAPSVPYRWQLGAMVVLEFLENVAESARAFFESFALLCASSYNHRSDQDQFAHDAAMAIETLSKE